MDERTALAATALEAFETAEPRSPSWNEVDRVWADRVALDAATAESSLDGFAGVRARHALQRLGPREPALGRLEGPSLREARWTVLAAAVAFGLGVFADSLGGSHRINLLAPPMWGVLVWNGFVYLGLLAWPLARLARRDREDRRGPIVRGVAERIRGRIRPPRVAAGGSAPALHRLAALWSARSRGLATRRAEVLLHAAAAALALGLVAGLYLRGLVLDYRVGWQSTFLTPEAARAIVAAVLAPASAVTGIAVPDVAAFAAMRVVDGVAQEGAPAAAWIHLLSLTLLLLVVLPRGLLALLAASRARWRAGRFPLPLEQPYYQRLARLQQGGAAKVVVYPYGGAAISPQATLGLRSLLGDAFGPRLAVEIAPGVAFGAEDDAALAVPPGTSHAIALFDLSATPESENQGRFVRRLGAALPAGAALAVVLDESQFARRFAGVGDRLAERREAWRRWGEGHACVPLPLGLEATPVPVDAAPSLLAAFAAPNASAPA